MKHSSDSRSAKGMAFDTVCDEHGDIHDCWTELGGSVDDMSLGEVREQLSQFGNISPDKIVFCKWQDIQMEEA